MTGDLLPGEGASWQDVVDGTAAWWLGLGDCRAMLEEMPDGCVDAVVTSPPYNTLQSASFNGGGKFKNDSHVAKVKAIGYDDAMPEADYQDWLNGILADCRRVAQGLVWVNHKIRYRDGVAIHPVRFLEGPIYSEVVWSRPGSMALNCQRFAPSHEVILGFGTPHWWDAGMNTAFTVWPLAAQPSSVHPCVFPIEIPRRLVAASVPPNGIACDPFAGSGTTGVACIQLGRGFIGRELSPDFHRDARARLGLAYGARQPSLFDALADVAVPA